MGSKIIEIFNKMAYNVLSALYQPFWAAVLLAFLTMFLYSYGKEHGWKKNNFIRNMFATWWRAFRSSSNFRRTFLLAFYTAMILLRTVLNREIWFDPLGKLFGGWGLYEDGQFTTESIENFMLFVPFSILLLWTFQKELLGESENIRFGKTVWEATKVVAVFSFLIEFTQLLFHIKGADRKVEKLRETQGLSELLTCVFAIGFCENFIITIVRLYNHCDIGHMLIMVSVSACFTLVFYARYIISGKNRIKMVLSIYDVLD